jgi:hypothetical protein
VHVSVSSRVINLRKVLCNNIFQLCRTVVVVFGAYSK